MGTSSTLSSPPRRARRSRARRSRRHRTPGSWHRTLGSWGGGVDVRSGTGGTEYLTDSWALPVLWVLHTAYAAAAGQWPRWQWQVARCKVLGLAAGPGRATRYALAGGGQAECGGGWPLAPGSKSRSVAPAAPAAHPVPPLLAASRQVPSPKLLPSKICCSAFSKAKPKPETRNPQYLYLVLQAAGPRGVQEKKKKTGVPTYLPFFEIF
jgi:hypothetical protein